LVPARASRTAKEELPVDDEPILTRRESATLLKATLALLGMIVAAPYVTGALCMAFLVLVAFVGIVAGLADWLLWYGLPTLGVLVICVLVLRWLFAPRRPDLRAGFSDDAETERAPSRRRDVRVETELDALREEIARGDDRIVRRRVDPR
jgi:energy-coupling factor transporter transmembrane protein EcfT